MNCHGRHASAGRRPPGRSAGLITGRPSVFSGRFHHVLLSSKDPLVSRSFPLLGVRLIGPQ
uniref:Uncharacterized protein n=1 Tax=Streptomyces sp. W75 TaxID=1170711 RepID=I0CEF2_9ACTN|nr:hypothetical protein pCQ4.40 [Streptomyces sp. W75]